MIYDLCTEAKRYMGIHTNLDKALEWMMNTDITKLPVGRNDIADGLYCNVMDITRRPAEEGQFERHEQYLDIQLTLAGEEHVGVLPLEALAWSAYDAVGDYALAQSPEMGTDVKLVPGNFAVLFPSDGHKPGIGTGNGRKAVIKVRL